MNRSSSILAPGDGHLFHRLAQAFVGFLVLGAFHARGVEFHKRGGQRTLRSERAPEGQPRFVEGVNLADASHPEISPCAVFFFAAFFQKVAPHMRPAVGEIEQNFPK